MDRPLSAHAIRRSYRYGDWINLHTELCKLHTELPNWTRLWNKEIQETILDIVLGDDIYDIPLEHRSEKLACLKELLRATYIAARRFGTHLLWDRQHKWRSLAKILARRVVPLWEHLWKHRHLFILSETLGMHVVKCVYFVAMMYDFELLGNGQPPVAEGNHGLYLVLYIYTINSDESLIDSGGSHIALSAFEVLMDAVPRERQDVVVRDVLHEVLENATSMTVYAKRFIRALRETRNVDEQLVPHFSAARWLLRVTALQDALTDACAGQAITIACQRQLCSSKLNRGATHTQVLFTAGEQLILVTPDNMTLFMKLLVTENEFFRLAAQYVVFRIHHDVVFNEDDPWAILLELSGNLLGLKNAKILSYAGLDEGGGDRVLIELRKVWLPTMAKLREPLSRSAPSWPGVFKVWKDVGHAFGLSENDTTMSRVFQPDPVPELPIDASLDMERMWRRRCHWPLCICWKHAHHALRQCGQCKTARYCSETCQTQDWEAHRQVCQKYRNS